MITPAKFIKNLKAKKLTVAFAESMTCGLAANKLASAIGTSEVLKGSIVCYTAEVKMFLLRVPKRILDVYTCESKETTESMVKELPKLIPADIHAAITGLAAPGGSETKKKPVGTVFLAVLFKGKVHNKKQVFRGTPKEIRLKACRALYSFILEILIS